MAPGDDQRGGAACRDGGAGPVHPPEAPFDGVAYPQRHHKRWMHRPEEVWSRSGSDYIATFLHAARAGITIGDPDDLGATRSWSRTRTAPAGHLGKWSIHFSITHRPGRVSKPPRGSQLDTRPHSRRRRDQIEECLARLLGESAHHWAPGAGRMRRPSPARQWRTRAPNVTARFPRRHPCIASYRPERHTLRRRQQGRRRSQRGHGPSGRDQRHHLLAGPAAPASGVASCHRQSSARRAPDGVTPAPVFQPLFVRS